MPEQVKLAKATLSEVKLADGNKHSEAVNPDATVTVQFNPETLKVTYSNTMEGDDQAGGSAIQFVSKSSTKLSVDLWFDVTVHEQEQRDVRKLTEKVNHFVTPRKTEGGGKKKKGGMAPPAVRFLWGSFLFEGVMESIDETLEFFSADGRPLRAKVAISITSQDIQFKIKELADGAAIPGTSPQMAMPEGQSLPQAMDQRGSSDGWQDVARGNGVENPRQLPPGSLIDPNRRLPAGARP